MNALDADRKVAEQAHNKLKIQLDKKQLRMLCKWMGAARFAYNRALAAIKRREIGFSRTKLQARFVLATHRATLRTHKNLQVRK